MATRAIYPPRKKHTRTKKGTPTSSFDSYIFRHKQKSAPAAGNIAEIRIGPPKAGTRWMIQRLSVSATSSVLSSAFNVYIPDSVDPSNIPEGTSAGNADIADENQAVLVEAGQVVLFRWSNIDNNAVGSVNAQILVEPA